VMRVLPKQAGSVHARAMGEGGRVVAAQYGGTAAKPSYAEGAVAEPPSGAGHHARPR
jgi:hypothetical protein